MAKGKTKKLMSKNNSLTFMALASVAILIIVISVMVTKIYSPQKINSSSAKDKDIVPESEIKLNDVENPNEDVVFPSEKDINQILKNKN